VFSYILIKLFQRVW